jgi:hypothetical protein
MEEKLIVRLETLVEFLERRDFVAERKRLTLYVCRSVQRHHRTSQGIERLDLLAPEDCY